MPHVILTFQESSRYSPGPSTLHSRTLVPKTIPSMAFGTRVLNTSGTWTLCDTNPEVLSAPRLLSSTGLGRADRSPFPIKPALYGSALPRHAPLQGCRVQALGVSGCRVGARSWFNQTLPDMGSMLGDMSEFTSFQANSKHRCQGTRSRSV